MTNKLVLLQIKDFIRDYRKNYPETIETMNLHNKILVAIYELEEQAKEEKLTAETK